MYSDMVEDKIRRGAEVMGDEIIKRVAAYVRVSTSSEDQLNSFINQKAIVKKAMEKHANHQLIKIYADRGLTATSEYKREAFLEMMVDAGLDILKTPYEEKKRKKFKLTPVVSDRTPLFDEIWVKNSSRFARNIEIVPFIRELRKKGVYVYFMDINKSTQSEADAFLIELFFLMGQEESADKSRKVRMGQRVGAEKGVFMSNSSLYGYKKVDKTTLEVIPEEAEVISFIYNSYAEGYGIRRLLELLSRKGYRTRKGVEFGKSTVKRILTNPLYKGDHIRNRYTTGVVFVDKSSTPRELPEDQWIVHEDAVPRIVDRELWEKCQEIRTSKVNHINQRGVNHGTDQYSGLIKCGKCGSSFVANIDRGRRFYNCSLKKTKGVKVCDMVNVSLQDIDILIDKYAHGHFAEEIVKGIHFEVGHLEDVKREIAHQLGKDTSQELAKAREDYREIKVKSEKLLDLHLDGMIDKNVYASRYNNLQLELGELNNIISSLTAKDEELYQEIDGIDHIMDLMFQLASSNLNKTFTREEIIEHIDRIVVNEDYSRAIQGKIKEIQEGNHSGEVFRPQDERRKRQARLSVELKIYQDIEKLLVKYLGAKVLKAKFHNSVGKKRTVPVKRKNGFKRKKRSMIIKVRPPK